MSSPLRPRGGGVDDLTRKQVLDLLEDGLSVRAVEHTLGVSKSAVQRIARDAGWEFPHEQVAEAARVRASKARDRRTAMANVLLTEIQRAVDQLQAASTVRDFGFAARAIADLSRSHVELARLDVGLADQLDTDDARGLVGGLLRQIRLVAGEPAAEDEGGSLAADHVPGPGLAAGHETAAS